MTRLSYLKVAYASIKFTEISVDRSDNLELQMIQRQLDDIMENQLKRGSEIGSELNGIFSQDD